MKPITELTREDIKDLKLICFDVDGVTIKKGTDIEEVKGFKLFEDRKSVSSDRDTAAEFQHD